jgi:RNA polymerase sigma factor (sigma-70 family)
MTSKKTTALREFIHSLARSTEGTVSDGELLRRFAREDDQAAFAALYRRHAPMVLGTCRRALPTVQDAEDACQATFVLLARKAKGGRWQDSIANWLYATARKVAANASRAAHRRVVREARAGAPEAVEQADMTARELLAALDEELDKLPPLYREPLLLCHLQGLTRDEAAYRLGVPLGTLKIRLERGRKKLHDALIARGLSLGAGLLVLAAASRAEASPPPLVESILAAAAGRTPAAVAALIKGAGMNGLMNKSVSLFLVAIAVIGLGVGLTAVSHPADSPPTDRSREPGKGRAAAAAVDALGDPLPTGAIARLGTARLRHGDGVFYAAYTPDGKGLLTAGLDQVISLWEQPSGKEIHRFGFESRKEAQTPETPLRFSVALSPDGKVVAAAREGALSVWEVPTGQLLYQRPIEGFGSDVHLAFASDGKALLLINKEDNAAVVWDMAAGKITKQVTKASGKEFAAAVAVSPDWKYLASLHLVAGQGNGNNRVSIKDLGTNRELPEVPVLGDRFSSLLAFSPNSKLLAWKANDGPVVLWDVAARKERLRLEGHGTRFPLNSLAFSPDGKLIAVSDRETAEVWDTQTGWKVASGGETWVDDSGTSVIPGLARLDCGALAFAPHSTMLAASFGGPSVMQLDAINSKRGAALDSWHRDGVTLISQSGNGQTVLTYSRGDPLRRWDLTTGRQVSQVAIPENATCAAGSADGQRIAAAVGNTITVHDAAGKQLWRHDGGRLQRAGAPLRVESLALSPDGRILAVREWLLPEVHLWDTTAGKRLVTLAQTQGVVKPSGTTPLQNVEGWGMMTLALAFSPDGRSIFGAGAKRQLARWDSRTGEVAWAVAFDAGQAVERFALSAGGHALATLNSDGTVTLYEAATGQQRLRLGKPAAKHGVLRPSYAAAGLSIPARKLDEPFAVAFSPDSRYLATAKDDSVIHLWDVVAGQEIGQLTGHKGGIVSLMFAPDGSRLLSGSMDTTVLAWDLGAIRKQAAAEERLDAKTLDALWADLAATDAAKAFAALRRLARSPAQAAALVKERVRPAVPPDAKTIAALITDLQSDVFAVRQKAEAGLEALGELAEPQIRQALAGDPSIEVRQRLQRLLKVTRPVRDLRVVELLELAGGADARRVLEELARGAASARLTREAQAAAQRLAQRP